MPDDRQAAVALLGASAESFSARLARVPAGAWNARPAVGWGMGDLMEHLALVETGVLKLLTRRMLTQPAPADLLAQTAGKDEAIEAFQRSGEQRVAPDFVTPAGKYPGVAEARAAFEAARREVMETYRTAPEDLRRYAAVHPVFGPLDAFQWALFLARHLERHQTQVDAILAGSLPAA
jgi:hypothetical protein